MYGCVCNLFTQTFVYTHTDMYSNILHVFFEWSGEQQLPHYFWLNRVVLFNLLTGEIV